MVDKMVPLLLPLQMEVLEQMLVLVVEAEEEADSFLLDQETTMQERALTVALVAQGK
jgi:hypothetical protein